VVKTPEGDPSLELDQQQRRSKRMQSRHDRSPSAMAFRALWVAEARYGGHWQQLRYRRLRTQEGMLQAPNGSKAVSSRSRQARAGHAQSFPSTPRRKIAVLLETRGTLERRTLKPGLCTQSSRSPQFQLQSRPEHKHKRKLADANTDHRRIRSPGTTTTRAGAIRDNRHHSKHTIDRPGMAVAAPRNE
jgi:hypothetical protein